MTSQDYKTIVRWVIEDKNSRKCVLYKTASKKKSVFKWRLELVSDDRDVTFDGRLFQTRDAAAAKERSPTVEQRVEGTTNEFVIIADRRCQRDWTSAVRRRLSVRLYGPYYGRCSSHLLDSCCRGKSACIMQRKLTLDTPGYRQPVN